MWAHTGNVGQVSAFVTVGGALTAPSTGLLGTWGSGPTSLAFVSMGDFRTSSFLDQKDQTLKRPVGLQCYAFCFLPSSLS